MAAPEITFSCAAISPASSTWPQFVQVEFGEILCRLPATAAASGIHPGCRISGTIAGTMSVPFAQRPWFKWLYLALFSYGAISNFYLGHPWIGAMLLVSVF